MRSWQVRSSAVLFLSAAPAGSKAIGTIDGPARFCRVDPLVPCVGSLCLQP
jgi:hypothetical protein